MNREHWSKLGGNLLALGLGVLIALLLLEVFLRIFDPIPYHVKGDKIVLPVNQKRTHRNGALPFLSDFVAVTKNTMGFRGENPPADFQEYLTIVTVGGSTTEEGDKSDNETWTHLLGEKLGENFERVWIQNAGLDGTSTFAHVLLMEDYIVRLRPKVVLFLIGGNDVEKEPDKFDLRLLQNEPNSLKTWLKKSEVVAYLLNFRRAYRARRNNLVNMPLFFTRDEITYLEISAEEQEKIFEKYTDHLEIYISRIEKLIRLARSHDIEPILITQPTPLGAVDPATGLNLATFELKSLSMNGALYWKVLKAINETAKSVAKKHDVLVIDLGEKMPKSTDFLYDLMHFTLAGSRKVSEIVYDELSAYLAEHYPEFKKQDF